MSTMIRQILDVIRDVQIHYSDPKNRFSIKKLRIEATKTVALNYGIEKTTISDIYIRRLKPEICKTSEFDRALQNWLRQDDNELREILRLHRLDGDDLTNISRILGQ